MPTVRDLAPGQIFGNWTVIEEAGDKGEPHRRWKCLCACGVIRIVRSDVLFLRSDASCGCIKRQADSLAKRGDVGQVGARSVHTSYRNAAKRRGLVFELELPECIRLTSAPCHYCGAPPSNRSRSKNKASYPETLARAQYAYSGLDRVDNMKGYLPGNVVPCCIMCNRAKSHYSLDEFLAWARRLAERNPKGTE